MLSGLCFAQLQTGAHYLTWKPISPWRKFLKQNWSSSPLLVLILSSAIQETSLLHFHDGFCVRCCSHPFNHPPRCVNGQASSAPAKDTAIEFWLCFFFFFPLFLLFGFSFILHSFLSSSFLPSFVSFYQKTFALETLFRNTITILPVEVLDPNLLHTRAALFLKTEF